MYFIRITNLPKIVLCWIPRLYNDNVVVRTSDTVLIIVVHYDDFNDRLSAKNIINFIPDTLWRRRHGLSSTDNKRWQIPFCSLSLSPFFFVLSFRPSFSQKIHFVRFARFLPQQICARVWRLGNPRQGFFGQTAARRCLSVYLYAPAFREPTSILYRHTHDADYYRNNVSDRKAYLWR